MVAPRCACPRAFWVRRMLRVSRKRSVAKEWRNTCGVTLSASYLLGISSHTEAYRAEKSPSIGIDELAGRDPDHCGSVRHWVGGVGVRRHALAQWLLGSYIRAPIDVLPMPNEVGSTLICVGAADSAPTTTSPGAKWERWAGGAPPPVGELLRRSKVPAPLGRARRG